MCDVYGKKSNAAFVVTRQMSAFFVRSVVYIATAFSFGVLTFSRDSWRLNLSRSHRISELPHHVWKVGLNRTFV